MTNFGRGGLLLGALGALCMASPAAAQDAAVEMKNGAVSGDVGEAEEAKSPMNWFGIGIKLGAGGNGEGELETDLGTATISSRAGFQMSLPINMGGDGFGWVIEPYLNMASFEGNAVDPTTGMAVKKDYGVTTIGGYTGPTINFQAMDPLYVGFGFGPKIGLASSDGFDFGADIMFRVPVTATYYLIDDVGLVAELGLGYGLTGLVALPTLDPMTGEDIEGSFETGAALTWDFSVGARWP